MIAVIIISAIVFVLALFFLYETYQKRQEERVKKQLDEVMTVFEKMGGKL